MRVFPCLSGGSRAAAGRGPQPGLGTFVLLETSPPSLMSEVLVHICVFPSPRCSKLPLVSLFREQPGRGTPLIPLPRSTQWDAGWLFPWPGLPAAAAALRGGPSRSRRALKASLRGGRTRSEPPAPAMGSLGRCLARGLLRGQPGVRLPFGLPRCYGSGETRPGPTLRAVPIPVPSHPYAPKDPLPILPLVPSLPHPWGPLSPSPSRAPSPSLGFGVGIPGGRHGASPGERGASCRSEPSPLSCPGTLCPRSSCTALTVMGTLVPAGRVLNAHHSFGAHTPPDPTLRAWGTSQGMGSGLGDKDRDGDGAVQGR